MISRRGFLTSLAAIGVVPFAPIPDPVPALKFHPQAFAFTMDPLVHQIVSMTIDHHFETYWGWPVEHQVSAASGLARHASACGGREQDEERNIYTRGHRHGWIGRHPYRNE